MAMPLNLPSSPNACLNQGLIFKRHLRIKSSRLPPNFFSQPSSFRYEVVPLISQDFANYSLSRDIQTPCFERHHLVGISNEESLQSERKVETARPPLVKMDHQLIRMRQSQSFGKQGNRVYRKYSLGTKLEGEASSPEKHIRLPKLLNKGILVK